jgi:hypothetical protein
MINLKTLPIVRNPAENPYRNGSLFYEGLQILARLSTGFAPLLNPGRSGNFIRRIGQVSRMTSGMRTAIFCSVFAFVFAANSLSAQAPDTTAKAAPKPAFDPDVLPGQDQSQPAQPDAPAQGTPQPAISQDMGPQIIQRPKPALPGPAMEAPSQQAPGQTPGSSATVRTGSQLGDGGDESFSSRLERLLADHQFADMESLLAEPDADDVTAPAPKPGHPARLTHQDKQFFQGILANRENKPEESIRFLEPLVAASSSSTTAPDPAHPQPAQQEKLLRKTLAEDYLRAGDWAKAAGAYQALNAKLGATLSPDEKSEIELPLNLLPLVAGNPAMTVESGDAFALPYDRDVLGLTDVPVFVDAQSHDWMLDPTAPFNLICRSTAREVGLKLSEKTATVTTITGRPMTVHATIIPRFTIGTITYRNMTAFVFEDADYYYPKTGYQVRGVLGYPAISALGSVSITQDSRIEVQPGAKGERLTTGARFFLDGERIIAALGPVGDERMYVIDAGGQQTYLTSRYYAEHSTEFDQKKMQLLTLPGSQGKPPTPAYVAEAATVLVGATPATFHFMQVLTEPLANSALDDTYGTLGMDALDELKSYTFDYRTMRFAIRNE